jgi:Tol biopolymer transport system component
VAISPDGRRAVVSRGRLTEAADIWIVDLVDGSAVPVTDDGRNFRPAWTPNGDAVVFTSTRSDVRVSPGGLLVRRRRADGSGPIDTLLRMQLPIGEVRISPDNRSILYRSTRRGSGRDIFYRTFDSISREIPFVVGQYQERSVDFSPDGKWVTYVSERSGRDEVYVEQFPQGGSRASISIDGGREPVWSVDGPEIFFRALDGFMMSARVSTRPNFTVTRREKLFSATDYLSNQFLTIYDEDRSGRFLMIKLENRTARTDAILVQNWSSEAKSALVGKTP